MNPSHPNRMNKIALEFLVIFVCMPFILYFDMPIVISAKLITLFVILAYPDELFKVPTTKPSLWIGISFVYVFLSVIPQEYIYRVFFFSRYQGLFSKPWAMIIASTICFCMVWAMVIYRGLRRYASVPELRSLLAPFGK